MLSADRFTVAVVFSLDIACLVSNEPEQQQKLQRDRSSGKLSQTLHDCLTDSERDFGSWVPEAPRIEARMEKAVRDGGVKVWSKRFLETYSPLLQVQHNNVLHVDGREVHDDGRLDPNGRRYRRRSFFRRAGYRLTPEGALVTTYQADFLDDIGYEIPEVIRSLGNFRADAFQSLQLFVREFFGNRRRGDLLYRATGLRFDQALTINADELDTACRRHQLIFLRGFWTDTVGRELAELGHALRSGELAGILTEAPWFENYGPRFLEQIRTNDFGHRADEIYLVGHHSTVVVAERYWRDLYTVIDAQNGHPTSGDLRDPLYWYQADLLTLIEHQLSRLALLRQQLAFFADHAERRPLEVQRPRDALPLVLDGRANLTQVSESLDFTSLARHGFTRDLASALRREMGIDDQLRAVRRRITDMSEAIDLKSSITSARAGNLIQAVALVVSAVALVVSVLALFVSTG